MKASYDAIAETYSAIYTDVDDPIRRDYLGRLVARLRSEGGGGGGGDTAKVLELGCGAGIPATKFLLETEKPLFHMTGNDISTAQLELAKSNLAKYTDRLALVEGDMLALEFPPASLDAVTGFYSIVHLPREEQTQLMGKIFEWLRPGGYFLANFSILTTSNHEEQKWLGHEKGWMFWAGWGEEKSVEMVENAGLKVEVKEVKQAENDSAYVWVLARKPAA